MADHIDYDEMNRKLGIDESKALCPLITFLLLLLRQVFETEE